MGSDLFRLDGRVAVITGASAGIGAAIAAELGQAGAAVVVVARRQEGVERVASELASDAIDAVGITADVRDEDSVERLFGQVRDRFGRLDVLVNNAGGSFGDSFGRGALLELGASDFTEAYRFNVVATYLCSRTAVPLMRHSGGGSIVQIGSMSGYQVQDGMGAYGPAKAALINLTTAMAREWAPAVRVNAVVPGYIDTPRVRAHRSPEEVARVLGEIALGSLGTPENVAAAVRFFAAPASSWITGTALRVDGGQKL